MLSLPEHCPHCAGPINVEDFAWEYAGRGDDVITLLYCDGCTHGWEELWHRSGRGWRRSQVCIEYTAADLAKLSAFLDRLRAARVVAA